MELRAPLSSLIPSRFCKLVGAAGFEPTTTRTPSECATGLRYAPTCSRLSSRPLSQILS